ncbi:MAG: glycosyltransferase [Sedimentisphaerales bacterium]|nr:glycosyltransferase [Sedimentisphaerales bacterium]
MGDTHSNMKDIYLGIVCPMANEKKTAVEFINSVLGQCQGFKQVTFFVIFDLACKDGTADMLRELAKQESRLKVVWSPENKCVVDAYIRGYKESCNSGCDWILEIDGGFSHNPADMPELFNKMSQNYDCVFGSRFCKGGTMMDAPLKRRIISRGGTMLVNLLLGTKLKDMTSGFELFTKSTLEAVLKNGIISRGHFFQTEIKVFCHRFHIAEVPIHYRSPSKSVNTGVLKDAFGNLFRLFKLRLSGNIK